DRVGEAPLEVGLAAEQAGVDELGDRPQRGEVVLDRGAGEGDADAPGEGADGPGGARAVALDGRGRGGDEGVEGDRAQEFDVAQGDRVGGDDDVGVEQWRGALGALRPVVEVDGQLRRESGDLTLPVADQGGGADDEVGGVAGAAHEQAYGL